MAHRLASDRTPSSPEWLRARWDRQRRETVARVTRAVDHLRSQERPVTFSAIRDAVKHLDGVSISTNTIQRNDLAYAVLSAVRVHPAVSPAPASIADRAAGRRPRHRARGAPYENDSTPSCLKRRTDCLADRTGARSEEARAPRACAARRTLAGDAERISGRIRSMSPAASTSSRASTRRCHAPPHRRTAHTAAAEPYYAIPPHT